MKSVKQLAAFYSVHYQSINNWLRLSGIKPDYLEPSTSGKKAGLLRVLDEQKQEQLHDWLIETGRIK